MTTISVIGLVDLKRKRDVLIGKQRKHTQCEAPSLTQQQLRDWANEQFAKLNEIAKRTEATLADRQLVESFIHRIEVDPDTKTATVYIYEDLQAVLASTRVVGGDSTGSRVKPIILGWNQEKP